MPIPTFESYISLIHSLLEFILRVCERAVTSSRTTSLMTKISAHAGLILAVHLRLQTPQTKYPYDATVHQRPKSARPHTQVTTCGVSWPFLLKFWMNSTRPWTTNFTANITFSSSSQDGATSSMQIQRNDHFAILLTVFSSRYVITISDYGPKHSPL